MVSLTKEDVAFDTGLRTYMASIYNWMMLGLFISAAAVFLADVTGLTNEIVKGGLLFWTILLSPFALIFYMAGGISKGGGRTVGAMATAFVIFTAIEGLMISSMVLKYSGTAVMSAFLITASGFAALSLWAYTTKRVLTGMGSFFLIALVGLLVTMVVAAFVGSTALDVLVSLVAIVLFGGLVAYDTQTMRAAYVAGDDEQNARSAVWYALDLYLDFLNLFLHVLRLFGISTGSSDD